MILILHVQMLSLSRCMMMDLHVEVTYALSADSTNAQTWFTANSHVDNGGAVMQTLDCVTSTVHSL